MSDHFSGQDKDRKLRGDIVRLVHKRLGMKRQLRIVEREVKVFSTLRNENVKTEQYLSSELEAKLFFRYFT